MIGVAAGMAMEKKIPICYSITPFAIYRPFEFIRNFMNHDKIPIKIVGGGRDKDYGYLGFTHWAEEDLDILKVLTNIRCYKPNPQDTMLTTIFREVINSPYPSYINLIK
jgi:transketolase